jgi:Mlc titration factor MtfA (ptsG expression regulator)
VFGLIRSARRRRVLARYSIPEALWREVVADIPMILRLGSAAENRLRDLALLFLHEKRIEAAGGLEIDESMRVRVAALACMPILELGLDCYAGFVSVIVYPDEFVVRDREIVDETGVVHLGDDVLSGEAWEQGGVILAWKDIEASGRGDGFNVVVHEFAHKLDLLGGAMDGMPPLHGHMRSEDWIRAFQAAYDELQAQLDRGEEPWLDPYAAEEPAEFFAVCAETFFEMPEAFLAEYPALYAQLSAFFKQNPAQCS